ncbi:MAG: hypothetical protein WC216_10330 [Gallionella sp.]|jgi:hypothetical protein
MMAFCDSRLEKTQLGQASILLLESFAECKGKQALYEKQSLQIFEGLRQLALAEGADSSTRDEPLAGRREAEKRKGCKMAEISKGWNPTLIW